MIGPLNSALRPAFSRTPAACLLMGFIFFFAFQTLDTLAASGGCRLVVENEADGHEFMSLPVRSGEEFQIEFLHSYDRFPFREFYRVERCDRICLVKMVFRSMLNGQGFVYRGARIRPDGWGEIDGISSCGSRIDFIMGSRGHANHRLFFGGRCYLLSDFIEEGTIVVIRVEDLSSH